MQIYWAGVVAQLAEQSSPIPEIHGLDPVNGKIIQWTYFLSTIEYYIKIKTKRGREWPKRVQIYSNKSKIRAKYLLENLFSFGQTKVPQTLQNFHNHKILRLSWFWFERNQFLFHRHRRDNVTPPPTFIFLFKKHFFFVHFFRFSIATSREQKDIWHPIWS